MAQGGILADARGLRPGRQGAAHATRGRRRAALLLVLALLSTVAGPWTGGTRAVATEAPVPLSWGYGWAGQLGNGKTVYINTPTVIPELSNIEAVSSGFLENIALAGDGTVSTWGYPAGAPRLVTGLPAATAIASGESFHLALTNDPVPGTAWAWGANGRGQLGDGATRDRAEPGQVLGMDGFTRIAAGGDRAYAVRFDGTLWRWGANDGGYSAITQPVQVASHVADVAVGAHMLVVLRDDGTVAGLDNVVDIAAGSDHALAVRSDGTVWAWGANWSGQMGTGDGEESATPKQVPGITTAVAVAASREHSVALLANGEALAWGDNLSGELGDGTNGGTMYGSRLSPVRVDGPLFTGMAAGDGRTFGVDAAGQVWGWGGNWDGAVNGRPSEYLQATPEEVLGGPDLTAVDAGYDHSLGIRPDGSLLAWGGNSLRSDR